MGNSHENLVLAVVGLPGAGKSEACQYLVEKTGWAKIHFGDVTAQLLKEQNLSVSEANERKVREEIRAKLGMGAYALVNMDKIKELYKTSNVILESFYSWEEYLEVKKVFGDRFKVLALYASPAVRLERLKNRPVRPLTETEFISRDYAQIENSHQAGPIARADFTIENQSSREELHAKIDLVIEKLSL